MKKFCIIFVTMILSVSAFAQDGKSLYAKYSDDPSVQAVYISPAMFKMIGRLPELKVDMDGGPLDLAPLIRSFTGFYLIQTGKEELKRSLDRDLRALSAKGLQELLMEAKNDGETVRIYTNGNDNVISSLVLMAVSGGDTTFIWLDGNILRTDLDELLARAAKGV